MPTTIDEQVERIRTAVLAKARMDRGLSPEEFEKLSSHVIDQMIRDKELVAFVRDKQRIWTEDDIRRISDKLRGPGGSAKEGYAARYQR